MTNVHNEPQHASLACAGQTSLKIFPLVHSLEEDRPTPPPYFNVKARPLITETECSSSTAQPIWAQRHQ